MATTVIVSMTNDARNRTSARDVDRLEENHLHVTFDQVADTASVVGSTHPPIGRRPSTAGA